METNLTEVYLDNSATTRCSERAKDLMVKVLMEDYGNPSSLHMKGVEAENYIKEAKKKIAKTLKVDEKEILFTSGGTESNNTALIGAALANKRAGNHIITTSIETRIVSSHTASRSSSSEMIPSASTFRYVTRKPSSSKYPVTAETDEGKTADLRWRAAEGHALRNRERTGCCCVR